MEHWVGTACNSCSARDTARDMARVQNVPPLPSLTITVINVHQNKNGKSTDQKSTTLAVPTALRDMRSALAFFRHAQVHSGGAILAAVRSAVAPPLHHVPQPPCPTRWWQSGRSLSSSSSTTRHDDDERGDLAQSRTHVNRSLISLQTDGSEPAAEPGSTVPGTEASAAEVGL